MFELPLQLVDDFLMDYHIGHALFLGFVLVVLGGLAVTKSIKVLGVNLILFGLLFVITPTAEMPTEYAFFGIALLVIGPIIVIAAND